jgi:hypothetical protein
VGALEKPFFLQVGDVFMDRGEGAEAEARGNLLIGWRVAILLGEGREEVEDLFLPPRDCHTPDYSE